jgi:hypothetical protein
MLALLLSAPSPALHKAAERAREAVIATCHIPAERLAIEQDEGSSLYSVALKGSDPLSDAQIDCFGDKIGGTADVALSIEDEQVSAHYGRVRQRKMMATARAMLRREAMLGRASAVHRRRGERLRSFAIRLEQFCNAAPHSVLEVTSGTIQIRTDTPKHQSGRQNARWFCVVNTAIVTGHDPITVPLPDPPIVYVY